MNVCPNCGITIDRFPDDDVRADVIKLMERIVRLVAKVELDQREVVDDGASDLLSDALVDIDTLSLRIGLTKDEYVSWQGSVDLPPAFRWRGGEK